MKQENYTSNSVFTHIQSITICHLHKTGHAGMGHGYSGSVPESQSSIFLQAMGRSAEKEGGSHARRLHLGRDAEKFGENVIFTTKGATLAPHASAGEEHKGLMLFPTLKRYNQNKAQQWCKILL